MNDMAGYLNAPPPIREAFDRAQRAAIDRDLAEQRERDEWWESEFADDPLVRERRTDRLIVEVIDGPAATEPTPVRGIGWTEHWQRRADAARRLGSRVAPAYDRDADPLLALDIREAWEQLTGSPIRANRSRCPHPDHEDRWPDCAVYANGFYCHACKAGGSIIDLGGYLYGLTPRGADFHRIRERLLADLGMEAAA